MELQRYEFFFNRPKHGIFAVFAKFQPSPAAKLGIFAVFAKFQPSPAAKLGIFAVFARFHDEKSGALAAGVIGRK